MLKDSQLDLCGRVDFARTAPLLGRDAGVFSFACAWLRRLLPGAGGHRAVGLRPLAHRGPPPPAAADRGPGLLPGVSIGHGEPSAGAAAGPREGGAEQLSLPHRRPLCHPRRRAAGLRPLPAGAGDQPGRGGALLFAAHRLRRERSLRRGWRTIWPATMCPPGNRPTSAGRRPAWSWRTWWSRWTLPSSPPLAPPDAGEALAGPLFPVRLRAGLPAAAGRQTCVWLDAESAKTDGVSAEKRNIASKISRSVYLMHSIIKADI